MTKQIKSERPARSRKKQPPGRDSIQTRYDFNDKERNELGQKLAAELHNRDSAELEKKQAMAQYTARIKTIASKIGELQNAVTSGYEMRATDVRVEFFPERRMKRYYQFHKGKLKESTFISEAPMEASDFELPPLIVPKPEKKKVTAEDLKPTPGDNEFKNGPKVVEDSRVNGGAEKKKRVKKDKTASAKPAPATETEQPELSGKDKAAGETE